jgi:Flp pilus assembly protein CpaB
MKVAIFSALVLVFGCGVLLGLMIRISVAPEMVPVLVAAVNLPGGTDLNQPGPMLALKSYPRNQVPPGAVTDVALLQDKLLARTLLMGEPCTIQDFTSVPPSLEAVTVGPVHRESSSAPPPIAGDRVDLVSTFPDKHGRLTITKTFMENVLVLAVNEPRASGNVAFSPWTVTVAVRPEETARLTEVVNRGGSI